MATVTAAEAWLGYKPRSFTLLELAEGDQVLDLGCGTGDDARELARLVRGVSVTGVDSDATKIAEAHRRSLGVPRPVEFRVSDGSRLELEDDVFDACRADRVFHHLDDPSKVLAEMVRVARSGARIVVSDTDYETLIVDAPDPLVTRRIVAHHAERMPSGRIGRRLPRLLREVGLEGIEVFPYTAVVTEYDEEVVKLRDKAEHARQAGEISDAECAGWVASLEEAARAGRFFCALTVFSVRGWKP